MAPRRRRRTRFVVGRHSQSRAIHKNETNVDSQMNGELKEERETADEWLEVRDNIQSAVTAMEQPTVEEVCTLLKEGEENINIAE